MWTRGREQIKKGTALRPWLLAVATAVVLFLVTEICNYNVKLSQMEKRNIFMNVAIIFCVLLTVYVLSDRWWISIGICGILFPVLGLINIYSIQFRNTPISARDLFNARSAMNVLGSYTITWSKRAALAVAVLLGLCAVALFCFKLERRKKHTWKHWGIQLLAGGVVIGAFFWWGCFAPNALKPANISTLRYEEGYQVYGFMQVSVEVFQKAAYKVEKPQGYSRGKVAVLEEKSGDTAEGLGLGKLASDISQADIFLIINESWYDLFLVSDMTTDVEVMPQIKNMENTIQGYIVEPHISSGTNLTEYEALTGNSLQLMQGITPFNSLHMEGATSIVSCLKEQGYETAVLHPESRDTYNRIVAYPAMGFDSYYFIDDFEKWEYWEQRTGYVTDESNFNNVLQVYNEMPDDSPRFFYNLTTQNHGAYALNSYWKSTVHVQEEFEDEWLGYEVNEYLSCVNLTDGAFANLIEKLKNQDRPVLVCMLGDHAPAFVESVADKELGPQEADMKLRSTPYVIWANYDLSGIDLPEFIGLPYIPAILVELAGARQIPYYDYMINEMLPQVPVLTAYSQYRDKDGNYYTYDEESPYEELLQSYFYMEYNTVKGKDGRSDTLFHLLEN